MTTPPSGLVRRLALPGVVDALRDARVVVVHGPRQCGKTTLVRRLAEERGGTYLTLDDPVVRDLARRDPEALLGAPRPIVLDEFQTGGDVLLGGVKRHVDRDPTPGAIVLTGSTRFTTVASLSESLAGRAEIIDLWPLSQGEIRGTRDRFVDLLFGDAPALRAFRAACTDRPEVLRAVRAGGFPAVIHRDDASRRRWYASYVRTLVERDVTELSRVRTADDLRRLLRVLAARTAQELNLADVARDLGIPRTTVAGWLPLLETVYVVQSLPSWSRNLSQRVIRHPKLHFTDTGLAASLIGADAAALLRPGHPALGSLVESFVAGEIRRQATWAATPVSLFHFRDATGPEADIVLEADDGRVAAIEVKAGAAFERRDVRGLELLRDRLGSAFAHGVVLYLGDTTVPLGNRLTALPLAALWES